MKWFIRYCDAFDVLLVTIENKKIDFLKVKNNLVILYSNNEIVGFNIFNPNIDKTKNNFLQNENYENYVKKEVSGYFKEVNFHKQFVITKVTKCEKIEGTHLSLCEVILNGQSIQIVCGAKNVRKDLVTVLATEGSWMPNGIRIGHGKLKGYDSFGMLCSAKELKIDSDPNASGIIELNLPDSYIGQKFEGVFGEK